MAYPNVETTERTKKTLALLVGVVIGLFIMWLWHYFMTLTAIDTLRDSIESQRVRVITLAEITDRNEADELAASVIKDCSLTERTRFDELQAKLTDTIRRTELIELDALFDVCGDFYATQKIFMTKRLEREVEDMATYVALLSSYYDKSVSEYRIADWRQLVESEKRQAETFTDLVGIQRTIIDSLIAGKNLSSPEIETALEQARDTQALQEVLNIEIDTLRTSLVSP